MAEKVQHSIKTPEVKRENSASKTRAMDYSQSMSSPVGQILSLQRTIGNQAVQRLIKSGALQTKLRIGQPGDKYVQEADRVADAVMRMPEPGVQRQVEPEEEEEEILQTKPLVDQITPLVQVQRQEEPEEEEEMLQAKPLAGQITPLVQRQIEPEEEEEEEMLQAQSREDATSEVTNDLESQINAIRGGGRPLAESERSYYEPRFGHDFSQVRMHTDTRAAESARAVNARAFTMGQDVVFGAGQYAPGTSEGRRLMAHELTHVIQQSKSSLVANPDHVARQTEGEKAARRAKVWLGTYKKLKIEVDVLKAAISEIKKGKSVAYNKNAGLKRIDNAAKLLGISSTKLNSLKADWEWLVDQRSISAKASYRKKQAGFFSSLRSPLEKIKKKYPGQQTHYWLKNSPAQVLEIIIKVADADLPADELWAYAFKEGLVDYIRKEIGLSVTTDPTEAQLKGVSVTKTISGFNYLGLDDFFSDLNAKRSPMIGFLPKGFDLKKVKKVNRINEKGRTVRSGEFPNMLMAVQGLLAMLKRRRALFKQDAKAFGYATPTQEEIVYWTYLYFNAGEFGGKKQLKKYKGRRKLSDWIKKKEYSNSIKLLQSYRMVKAMKIFR